MAALSPSKLKESIRQSFRKACLMRLDGKEAEAVQILQEELPALIKEWHELEECAPAEVEALLAEELSRTESAHWVVKELEGRVKKNFEGVLTQSQAEAMHAVLEAKHQLEINNLKAQLETSLAELRERNEASMGELQSCTHTSMGELQNRVERTLGELITYSGAEAMGGRISQELSERVRTTLTEMLAQQATLLKQVPTKEDFEIQVDGIRAAVLEAALKKTDLQASLAALPERKEVEAFIDSARAALEQAALKKGDVENLIAQAQTTLQSHLKSLEAAAKTHSESMEARIAQLVVKKDVETIQSVLNELPARKDVEAMIESARASVVDTSLKKHDLETGLWQAQNAITDKLEGRLRNLEGEAEKSSQALNVMLTEVRTLLSDQLQKLVSAEMFEARLMAASNMLHEAHNREIQEAVAQLQNSLETRLNETVGPVHQRVSSLITFADWERVSKAADEKTLLQFEGLQTQAIGSLAAQQAQALSGITTAQQSFLAGLQRDWELLNKNLEELKRRQIALEGDLRGVAVVVDDFRQEQAKTRESVSGAMNLMTEQLKAMDEANRQLKLTLPQALQSFERQTETRLRDQAQLYQAEISALHHKLETTLTDAFGKKLKTLKVVAE